MYDTVIIGGGASGIFSAINAARRGKSVLLCERLSRVGKKILSTGNGRCNISNQNITQERYHGTSPLFSASALTSFSAYDTVSFFESIGLSVCEGENGKLYPKSLQATSVLDLMRLELARLGVSETVDCFIKKIEKIKEGFKLTSEDNRVFSAKKVILATGGKAAPSMGTDGNGYALVSCLGHTIIKPFPSLVQVKTQPPMRALKGVKHHGEITVYIDNKPKRTESGEILFTDYGVSGPPVFNLSRFASKGITDGRDVTFKLNLFPEFSEDSLSSFLKERRRTLPHLTGENFLCGLLPKLLAREVLKISKSDKDLPRFLTALPLTVTGVMPWANAQVTAGGIATNEVNPKTMESLLVPGLFFCGEVLDIDGDCGGYNLQWAWSSAYVAAQNI
ncbi:MAG: NAD(P)/FAD-dependent oxidoreductase [Clostridia bacterium]|nr:NAD(P)/FAD-dependent oxidoreductase [Clostridia bacterium]